jgi:hypothetical protein
MGATESSPPRVHTRLKPALLGAVYGATLAAVQGRLGPLLGNAHRVTVLVPYSEVASKPSEGQTASPNPHPHGVLRAGRGTRSSRASLGGGDGGSACAKSACACGERGGGGRESMGPTPMEATRRAIMMITQRPRDSMQVAGHTISGHVTEAEEGVRE